MRLYTIIVELLIIIVLLITMMVMQGCATANGLHYPNGARNTVAKWQQNYEQSKNIAK